MSRMIPAAAAIAAAERDLGVSETPPGSNRGTRIDQMAANWGDWMLGQPWCGSALYDWYKQAGFPTDANPAHPSTQVMWDRATANGTLTSTPVPGCAIVWEGIHTGLVVAVGDDVVHTIEGNSSDGVRRRVRPRVGTHRYIVPRGLTQAAPRQTTWWLEDPKAKYEIKGPWRKKASAEKAYRSLTPARARRASVLRTGDGKWVLRIGQPRHYGPWLTQAAAKHAQQKLEATLGRRLRRYTKTRPIPTAAVGGTADDLGKTT